MEVIKITTEEQLQQALKIRKEVFVDEQGVDADLEYDRYDVLNGPCEHVLVTYENKPVGTGRLRAVEGYGKLERICLLKSYRKHGLGKVIVQGLEELAANKGLTKTKLHGQVQAEGFYQKLGYETVSEPFMEDGIVHVVMEKELPAAGMQK